MLPSPRQIKFPNGASFTLDTLVNLFVDSLSDPIRPSHCALFYTSALTKLIDLPTMQVLTELRASRHDLLETCLIFLTTPRSQDEIRALQNTMETCSCPKDNPLSNGLHRYCPPLKQRRSLFPEIIDDISIMLVSCIINHKEPTNVPMLHNFRKRTLKEERRGKTPMWPITPDWAYMYQRLPSFTLLNCIIILAGTTLSIMIFTMPSFAPELIEMMNKNVDSLEKINSVADRDSTILNAVENTAYLMTSEMIARGEGRRSRAYWQDHKEVLLQALSRVVSVTSGTHFHGDLVQRACLIHDILYVPLDPAKYHPLIIEGSRALCKEHEKENHFWMAYRLIRQVTVSDRCHSPGCLETFTNAGRKFQFCSGCLRVPYCSKKCQVRAWKLDKAPHKIICPLVREFSDQTRLPYKFSDKQLPLAPDVAEKMCQEKGVDEEKARAIHLYFRMLDTLMVDP
ncbi:hypothetical protein EV421DRAFT_2000409 [Armillaria borealis]|uniref:MYND-type domain-containing protein n=1 Tax=Armillaria borealis TaxID=47425 RepID=A0AA39MGI0_9AGAR|nr:hypothetical protein EV421DRAFT_2000409 [Armillaria borealis]